MPSRQRPESLTHRDKCAFGTEREEIQEEGQGDVAILEQLKPEFPEIHLGIGHGPRRFLGANKERHRQRCADRPVTLLEGVEQEIELVLAAAEPWQKPGHRTRGLCRDPLTGRGDPGLV